MIRILLISILYTCIVLANHINISNEEWIKSPSKIEFTKKLNYIVKASKKPLYQLRFELLENIITPLIDSQEIKALIITDKFSTIPFLTAYKENNKTNININQKEKLLDKTLYFLLKSKIVFNDIYIADVMLYIDKSKINIPNKKDHIIEIDLNKEEVNYLKEKKELKICTIPNALPYEKIDEKNNHIGFFSEITRLIKKSININMSIVQTTSFAQSLSYIKQRKCDILIGVIKTSNRDKFLDFTDTYLIETLVIATNNNELFINNTKDLYKKKVGIIRDYAFFKLLKEKYPDIYFVEVKNVIDGLQKVRNNELFAFVDTLSTITYNIQNELFPNLKISGKLKEEIEFRTASRSDEKILNSILQKAHNSISENQVESILKKWTNIQIKQTINFRYLQEISIVFIILILLTLFWTRKLSKANKKLKKTKKYLQKTLKELEDSHKELEILASRDSMTGLFNRGYFKRVSIHILSLAKRKDREIAIILLDIDNFKKVNDNYGHPIGDEVIISLSNKIKSIHRKSDLSCRFGGEEFIILLPETNMKNALLLAEKIRCETENIKVNIEDNKFVQFTVSIGVSLVHVKNEESVEKAIKRADEALYEAKKSGKNKVNARY